MKKHELGQAVLSTKPKDVRPTSYARTHARPDLFGRMPGDPHYGEDRPSDVLVGGDRLGSVSDTIKWLNRVYPSPSHAHGNTGVSQFTNGATYFYPDNWKTVGAFHLYDPKDFGSKGKPYWVYLDPPNPGGGSLEPWAKGEWGGAQKTLGYNWPQEKDKYGRPITDPNYGADSGIGGPPTMKPFH